MRYRSSYRRRTKSTVDLILGCLPALAVKLRFHLNGSDQAVRQNSMQWQDGFIDAMTLYQSDVIDVAFVAADSLQVRHVTLAPAVTVGAL